jgi:hypothetical protein
MLNNLMIKSNRLIHLNLVSSQKIVLMLESFKIINVVKKMYLCLNSIKKSPFFVISGGGISIAACQTSITKHQITTNRSKLDSTTTWY